MEVLATEEIITQRLQEYKLTLMVCERSKQVGKAEEYVEYIKQLESHLQKLYFDGEATEREQDLPPAHPLASVIASLTDEEVQMIQDSENDEIKIAILEMLEMRLDFKIIDKRGSNYNTPHQSPGHIAREMPNVGDEMRDRTLSSSSVYSQSSNSGRPSGRSFSSRSRRKNGARSSGKRSGVSRQHRITLEEIDFSEPSCSGDRDDNMDISYSATDSKTNLMTVVTTVTEDELISSQRIRSTARPVAKPRTPPRRRGHRKTLSKSLSLTKYDFFQMIGMKGKKEEAEEQGGSHTTV